MMPKEYKLEGLCVDVRCLVMGVISNNVYIISDGEGTFVVDPSIDAPRIVEALDGARLDAIVLTHFHWDHMGAAAELHELTGAPVIASAIDAPMIEDPQEGFASRTAPACPVDQRVGNGDIVRIGAMEWKTISTPGHTKGSICLFCIPQFGNHPDGLPVLISGDTLFAGTTGRTDFPGGSDEEMAASIKKLAMLPDDTVVLPGHDSPTTIAAERQRVFARFGWEPDNH